MKVVGRKLFGRAMVCAAIGFMTLAIFSRTKIAVADQQAAGQWIDHANPSDELVDGPYRVDPNWPKPLATLFPEEKGWTCGAGRIRPEPGPHLRSDARRTARRNEDQAQIRRTRERVRHAGTLAGPWGRDVPAERLRGSIRQPGRSLQRLHGRRRKGLPLETHHYGLRRPGECE